MGLPAVTTQHREQDAMSTKYISDRSNARKYAVRHGGTFVGPVKIDGRTMFAVSLPDADDEPTRDINDDVAPLDLSAEVPEAAPPLGHELDQALAELKAETQPETSPEAETDVILMQLRVYVSADYACALARKVASLVGNPVNVHKAASGTMLQTVQPGNGKPTSERKATAPRVNGERINPTHERLKARMRTAEGLSLAEIVAETGWIESASRKFVWTLRNKKGIAVQDRKEADRGLVYFLPSA
jgi:hypothetical protein